MDRSARFQALPEWSPCDQELLPGPSPSPLCNSSDTELFPLKVVTTPIPSLTPQQVLSEAPSAHSVLECGWRVLYQRSPGCYRTGGGALCNKLPLVQLLHPTAWTLLILLTLANLPSSDFALDDPTSPHPLIPVCFQEF